MQLGCDSLLVAVGTHTHTLLLPGSLLVDMLLVTRCNGGPAHLYTLECEVAYL